MKLVCLLKNFKNLNKIRVDIGFIKKKVTTSLLKFYWLL